MTFGHVGIKNVELEMARVRLTQPQPTSWQHNVRDYSPIVGPDLMSLHAWAKKLYFGKFGLLWEAQDFEPVLKLKCWLKLPRLEKGEHGTKFWN